jgi:acetyl-CoA carboxylase biotin carboxyl carrier protein
MRDGRIEYLIHLVEKSEITELEIREAWGRRIRITKRAAAPPAAHSAVPVAAHAPAVAPSPPAAAPEPAAAAPADAENLERVVSPMVGTFYRAPSPDAPPFVEVGSQVAPGQTICIIEAMKLMNEITSEVAGSIRRVLVENAQPVEFGQPLFLIEKSS